MGMLDSVQNDLYSSKIQVPKIIFWRLHIIVISYRYQIEIGVTPWIRFRQRQIAKTLFR
jgi:hypothetical protein